MVSCKLLRSIFADRGLIPISQNSGQNCIGIERVLVHSSQYDQVFKLLAERAQQLRLGSALSRPTDGLVPVVDCGAMISNEEFNKLKSWIEAAVNHGAVLETGGQPWPHPYLENGLFFSPTVIGNVDPNSMIAQNEGELSIFLLVPSDHSCCFSIVVFAPIVLVMKYETLDEAVQIANGTRYGLGASVFGPDQEKCEQLAKKLLCGMVAINDFATFYVSRPIPLELNSPLTIMSPPDKVKPSPHTMTSRLNTHFLGFFFSIAKTFPLVERRCLDMAGSVDLKVSARSRTQRRSSQTGGHGSSKRPSLGSWTIRYAP